MSYNFMKNGVGASPPTMSRPIAKIKSQVPRADNISPRRGEKLHESGMYQKALAVSEAHAVDEEPTNGTITRKVVRQVEVPYTRKVYCASPCIWLLVLRWQCDPPFCFARGYLLCTFCTLCCTSRQGW